MNAVIDKPRGKQAPKATPPLAGDAPLRDKTATIATEASCVFPASADCLLAQACDVAGVVANNNATDLHWGIHGLLMRCAERAADIYENEHSDGVINALEALSTEMAGVVGIIEALTPTLDDPLLYAVETLAVSAKAQIDADIGASRRAMGEVAQ